VVGVASGLWVLTFALFLLLTKKEYRRTFFSTQLGKQWTMNYFLQGEGVEVKSEIVTSNKKQWRSIRGEVKEWAQANWWRWDEEKPEWMTESWIAKVPPDMLPTEAAQAANKIRAGARERSSLAFGVAKEEDTRKDKSDENELAFFSRQGRRGQEGGGERRGRARSADGEHGPDRRQASAARF